MGKKWDNTGIAYNVELWKECLRVLKPGGHLLAFGGSRTYHRMACTIEDAGFEIRDQIMWLYGCYSEDTECLTRSGFKKYHELTEEDEILQWDCNTNELTWYKPQEIFVYDYNGEMVTVKNRHTDQLLTPNHRVYAKIKRHSRNPKPSDYEVIEASLIKKHWIKSFPLAGELKIGGVIEHPYLIGWWLTDAWVHGDGKACMFSQTKIKTLNKLRDYLQKNHVTYSEYVKERNNINHNNEHTFYVTGDVAQYLLSKFPKRELTWEVLNWDFESRYQLLEGLLDGDGSRGEDRGYSEVFWSQTNERLDIIQALCCSLNIRSHIDYQKGCVYLNRHHNSTQLQCKHYTKPIQYDGKVWCLKTETGAFVVRRNGKIFISGNSGFPKSHDISKAIDKQGEKTRLFDVVREFLKKSLEESKLSLKDINEKMNYATNGSGMAGHWFANISQQTLPTKEQWFKLKDILKFSDDLDEIFKKCTTPYERPVIGKLQNPASSIYGSQMKSKDINLTESYCDNAQQWNGWGTALKPAHEPIAVARKPLSEKTVADNVLKWGTGGINIDGCRVEYGINESPEDLARSSQGFTSKSNIYHNDENKYKTNCKTGNTTGRFPANLIFDEEAGQMLDKQSDGASRFFYCAKASKKERGEGNTHPTVKPLKLIEYLITLVTPPDGIVLDPFIGSGTLALASKNKNFNFIGFELEKDSVEIANQRIKKWGA